MTLGLARSGACGPQQAAPAPAPQPSPQPQGNAEEELLSDIEAHGGVWVRGGVLLPGRSCLDSSARCQDSYCHGDPRGYKVRYPGARLLPRR